MEEGSTEIRRRRWHRDQKTKEQDDALKQARLAPGRPQGRPVEKAGRPPVDWCAQRAQENVGRPPGRPTESRLLFVWVRSIGRSTDRRVLAFLSGFRFLFCLGSNPIGVS